MYYTALKVKMVLYKRWLRLLTLTDKKIDISCHNDGVIEKSQSL